jgi:hypothetical protein
MPLALNIPTVIKPEVTATAFEIQGFEVNVSGRVMDIQYMFGTMDVNTFIPQGDSLNLHIEGQEFLDFIANNPMLYPSIKSALYTLIEAKQGVSGTIL